MCNQESHQELSRPEHFTRHAMKVETDCAAVRRGLGTISIERTMTEASEALTLADDGVSAECTRMLRYAVEGDLQAAARA